MVGAIYGKKKRGPKPFGLEPQSVLTLSIARQKEGSLLFDISTVGSLFV